MSQSKAGSSKLPELVPGSAYSFAVALRARHGTLDPAVFTETLRLEPVHCWKAGEPRVSQSGAPMGGQHRDSYWSAPLPFETTAGVTPSLELALSQMLMQLSRHRDFFKRLQKDGAEVSVVIELQAIPPGSALTFSPVIVRRLAELGLEMEIQFVDE